MTYSYIIENNITGERYEFTSEESFYNYLEVIKTDFISVNHLDGLESEPSKIYTFKPYKIRIDEDYNEDASIKAIATIDTADAWAWADKEGSF